MLLSHLLSFEVGIWQRFSVSMGRLTDQHSSIKLYLDIDYQKKIVQYLYNKSFDHYQVSRVT